MSTTSFTDTIYALDHRSKGLKWLDTLPIGPNKDQFLPTDSDWFREQGLDPRLDYKHESIKRLDLHHLQLDHFYPLYYLQIYDDVRDWAEGPHRINRAIAHYTRNGIKEGRSPNPFFDPKFYARHNADLLERDRDHSRPGRPGNAGQGPQW